MPRAPVVHPRALGPLARLLPRGPRDKAARPEREHEDEHAGRACAEGQQQEPADRADAERVFNALAEGGDVTQELIPTFFSEAFGMCTDRFGTPWMIVGPQAQPA